MRYCALCGEYKPFNGAQYLNCTKASGFFGVKCWDCFLKISKARLAIKNATPIGKAKNTANALAWAKANPGKSTAKSRAYITRKLQRIMPWTEHNAIKALYIEASTKNLTVDHIVPLRGKNVSGLHVLANLQLLTRSENSRKSNNY